MGSRAALTSSSRRTGVVTGAALTFSGAARHSSMIAARAAAKASRVSFVSFSVG